MNDDIDALDVLLGNMTFYGGLALICVTAVLALIGAVACVLML